MEEKGDSVVVALNENTLERMNKFVNQADACVLAGDMAGALEEIGKGIELNLPDELLSLLYYKRAGIHAKLMDWSKVVQDSTAAIQKRSNFASALFRRYEGNRATGDLEEALEDLIYFCSLAEGNATLPEIRMFMEEILAVLGRAEAENQIPRQQPKAPSNTVVQAFFEDYATDPVAKWWKGEKVAKLETGSSSGDSGQKGFAGAISALASKDYAKIIEFCTEELANPESLFKDEASLLRGTFMYLWSYDKEEYFRDWDHVIDSSTADNDLKTSALVKKGRAHAQKFKNKEESVKCFEMAQELSPENADVYFQRSNAVVEAVNNDLGHLMESMHYVKRALELRSDFSYAAILLAYIEFSIGVLRKEDLEILNAVKAMDKYVTQFPELSFVHNARGHMHKQLGEHFAAWSSFSQASELEPENMGYLGQVIVGFFEINGDHDAAISALNKAIERDDKLSVVYEQMGSVKHMSGDLEGALGSIEKGLQVAFSIPDFVSLYSLKKAVEVQRKVQTLLKQSDLESTLMNLMLG